MTDRRPITSKARGICKYYTTERGCFNANSCKFLHSTEPAIDPSGSRPPLLTPYDQAKQCKYYARGEKNSILNYRSIYLTLAIGYCKRGDKCWFIHEKGVAGAKAEYDDDDCCSICFERPSLYGLLGMSWIPTLISTTDLFVPGGCNHIFCIDVCYLRHPAKSLVPSSLTIYKCIRKWRDPSGKGPDNSNLKKCPMCRAQCRYIIPSSRFVKDGREKERIIQNYKDSMARVPCMCVCYLTPLCHLAKQFQAFCDYQS